jgi:hypothetical protein
MGRHSARAYRPTHTAHSALYWRLVMWPTALQRAVSRSQPGRRRVAASRPRHQAASSAPIVTPRGFPREPLSETWRADEGDVRPTW